MRPLIPCRVLLFDLFAGDLCFCDQLRFVSVRFKLFEPDLTGHRVEGLAVVSLEGSAKLQPRLGLQPVGHAVSQHEAVDVTQEFSTCRVLGRLYGPGQSVLDDGTFGPVPSGIQFQLSLKVDRMILRLVVLIDSFCGYLYTVLSMCF